MVNEYFKKMLDAKKNNKKSFKYNGKEYVGVKHKNLGMVYKLKGGNGCSKMKKGCDKMKGGGKKTKKCKCKKCKCIKCKC